MKALDQAFIKAFSQQGASPVVSPRRTTVRTPEPRAPQDELKKEAVEDREAVA